MQIRPETGDDKEAIFEINKQVNRLGISAPFEVPGEAFMAIECIRGTWKQKNGCVKYPPVFDAVA
jgi:predicted N-acetyltransferase YhbS